MSAQSRSTGEAGLSVAEDRHRVWYSVLSQFPFYFLPITAVIGIVLSIVMPHLTGVADH